MDDQNKPWSNQQQHSPPQAQQSSQSQPGFTQSTPITSFTSVNSNGYPNWAFPPQFYHQYAQLISQNQHMNNVSPTFAQTPLTQTPNFSNVPAMPNMPPFFHYNFPNPLQQQNQTFSPITPMVGSPMSNGSMIGSPMVGSPSMSDQSTPRNTMIVERKRPRITYTPDQIRFLEEWYNNNNRFITSLERNQIAAQLNVAPSQIRIWFQNRRARERQRNSQSSSRSSNDSGLNSTNSNLTNESTYSSLSMNGMGDSGTGMNGTATSNTSTMNAATSSMSQLNTPNPSMFNPHMLSSNTVTSNMQHLNIATSNMPPPNMPNTNLPFAGFPPTTLNQQQMAMDPSILEFLRYKQQNNQAPPASNAAVPTSQPKPNFESKNGQE